MNENTVNLIAVLSLAGITIAAIIRRDHDLALAMGSALAGFLGAHRKVSSAVVSIAALSIGTAAMIRSH